MKKIKNLLLFSLVVVSSSCFINRQRQVLFTELKDAHEAENKNVVRLYIDKRGKLYPDRVYIPFKDFFRVGDKGSTNKVNQNTGSLESYFTKRERAYTMLAAAYNLPPGTDPTQGFIRAQQLIFNDRIAGINELLLKGTSKTLIVMVHGFNDPNPSGDYQRMRDYIKTYKKIEDAVYLEIYWDGLTANQGNPGLSKIWKPAQTNSAYVANAVRAVLNGIDQAAHVRIITHSLGASVGTGSLFNTYSKWRNPTGQDYHTQMMQVRAPQQNDIRIGMIAPAIPGVATFADFNHREGTTSIAPANNNISRVVVGYKETDIAMRKGFFKKTRILSKVYGAITLGSNAKTNGKPELDRVIDKMRDLGYTDPRAVIKIVDFNSTGIYYEDEHGLYFYMKNDAALKLFLDHLFD